MKIFHTGDWHIGKLVNQVYMTEDQAYILEQLVQLMQRVQFQQPSQSERNSSTSSKVLLMPFRKSSVTPFVDLLVRDSNSL